MSVLTMVKGPVIVIHPDLGVGGAERLIVDASKALQDKGHPVKIYTSYHDKTRCFEETRDGSLTVITVGQWIPRTIGGRCLAMMSYLKVFYIALYLLFTAQPCELLLCDQVPSCIPIFKLKNLLSSRPSKIVFYCHFPDQLLTSRESAIKKIYRYFIDMFEAWSISLADIILVNSKFTRQVVRDTFKSLKDRNLEVLYPCVDIKKFEDQKPSLYECNKFKIRHNKLVEAKFILLSLNRFERKKDLGLAIKEFQSFRNEYHSNNKDSFKNQQLIIAGGYDERLDDCVNYFKELEELVSSCCLENNVTFFKSPSDKEKLILLEICDAVIYTPQNEHFGIVPIEAMVMRKPVIACNSGGPLETIRDNVCGYLNIPELLHNSIRNVTLRKHDLSMGEAGYKNVMERFSYEAFRNKLNRICF